MLAAAVPTDCPSGGWKRLIGWLREGDVVLMEPSSSQASRGRRGDSGGRRTPIYLPPYSPDFNPVEFWWADVKRQLRKLGIDSEPDLLAAIVPFGTG